MSGISMNGINIVSVDLHEMHIIQASTLRSVFSVMFTVTSHSVQLQYPEF